MHGADAEEKNKDLKRELASIEAQIANSQAESEKLQTNIVQASIQKEADAQTTKKLVQEATQKQAQIDQQENQISQLEIQVAAMEKDVNGIRIIAAKYG